MATRIQGIRKSQVTSLFHFDIIALWFLIAIYRHFDMIAIWFLTPKTAFIVTLCNFSAFISHQLTLFNFLREMSFTSHGKENTCLAVKTGTILHKKCFTIFSIYFSIVAHSDEYLHIWLNIYLLIILNIYLFIIYLNIYLFIILNIHLFIIYIFNPCRWRRQ